MDQPGVLFLVCLMVSIKKKIEKGQFCAYKVCKYCSCGSKNLVY